MLYIHVSAEGFHASLLVCLEKPGSKICEQASPELFAVHILHHSSSAELGSWSVIADEDDYDAQEAQPASNKKTPKSAKKSAPTLRQVAKTFDDLCPSMLTVSDSVGMGVCVRMALPVLLSWSRCQLWMVDDHKS